MNIDIRSYILKNFKGSNSNEIRSSIVDSIKDKDEVTLPGLGVFFEILWLNCSEKEKNVIIDKITKNVSD